MSGNFSLDCPPESTDADDVRMAVIVLMGSAVSFIGIVLNSFLLLSFCRLPTLHSNMLYFFLLAAFDILVEICFVLIFVTSLVWDYYRVYPLYVYWHHYIRYVSTAGQVLIAASTLLIVAASFERYFCSLKSHGGFSKRQRISAIAVALIVALAMKGSVFFELELQYMPECPFFSDLQLFPSAITKSEDYRNLWMFWGRSILNVILPFCLLLLLNAATISNLSKSSKDFESVLVEQLPSLLRANTEASSARRRKRDATRTLAALVSIYLVSNSLNMIITIMEFVDQASLLEMGNGWTYKYLADLSSLLTISSTAFRLPVYYHCNRDMRFRIRQSSISCGPAPHKSMPQAL